MALTSPPHNRVPGLLSLISVLAAGAGFAGAAEMPGTDSGVRDHAIFLGLTLVLEGARGEEAVEWMDGSNVEVRRDGELVKVSRQGASVNSRLEPRIGGIGVTIDDLRGRRCFSYNNNPDRAQLGEQLALLSAQAQRQDSATMERYRAMSNLERTQIGNSNNPQSTTVREAQQRLDQSMRQVAESYSNPQFSPDQSSGVTESAVDTGGPGTFDAFEAIFTVSAPQRIDNVVGVLRLFVRDPARPANAAPVHRFFRIREIGPEPRKITVAQERLPRGFAEDEFTIHLFAGGVELPSNTSKSRVDVTVAEAHQFLVLQHMQRNKGGNTSVAIIPTLLDPGLRSLITPEHRNALVDVAVDADGNVSKAEPLPPGSDPVPADLAAALRQVRFLPPLVNGLPVEGRGSFALSEFAP